MTNKRDILLYLRDHNILAPNASQLTKELGRSDKHLLNDRLDNAKEDSKAVADLWEAIKTTYNISEYTLSHLPMFWELSSQLADQATQDDFIDLCNRKLSAIKDSTIKSQLRSIYKESVLDYGHVLALFIAKVTKHDPNQHKDSSALIEVLQLTDGLLLQQYPEGTGGHNTATDLLSQAKAKKMPGWAGIFIMVGRVICYYTHPLFLDQIAAADFAPLPVEEDSWWVAPSANEQTAVLWHLFPIEEGSGIYNVWQWETATAQCTMQRWGFFRNYNNMRCVELKNNKVVRWNFYDFTFWQTEETAIIELSANATLGSKNGIVLPERLQQVTDDSVWGRWIAQQDEQQMEQKESEIFLQALGVEETEMEVVDVTMSRNVCTLHIKNGNSGLRMVQLKIDKYPGLHSISVWDDVYILRGLADGNLYAWWKKPNIRICLPKEIL